MVKEEEKEINLFNLELNLKGRESVEYEGGGGVGAKRKRPGEGGRRQSVKSRGGGLKQKPPKLYKGRGGGGLRRLI